MFAPRPAVGLAPLPPGGTPSGAPNGAPGVGLVAAIASAGELVAAFLAGRNARTLAAYSADLEDFAAFVGAADVNAAADALLAAGHGGANATALRYRAHLQGRGLAPATINRRLAALRSLVKLARTLGVVPWALDVEGMRSEHYRDTRGPGRDGVRALLAALEGRADPKAVRDRAALRLLYDVALRRGEVVALDVADVDLAAGTLAVVGKGRTEPKPVTLSPTARDALAAWLAVRGDAPGPLFVNLDPVRTGAKARTAGGRLSGTSLYRAVRQLGARAGLRVWPHGLRHAAITRVLEACNGNVAHAREFSRHRDVRTLMVYDDNRSDRAGALAAIIGDEL